MIILADEGAIAVLDADEAIRLKAGERAPRRHPARAELRRDQPVRRQARSRRIGAGLDVAAQFARDPTPERLGAVGISVGGRDIIHADRARRGGIHAPVMTHPHKKV